MSLVDLLAVMGHLAAIAVEVALTYGQWIFANLAGNIIHGRFDNHHPLGATEAPECGIRGGMGFCSMTDYLGVPQRVGVVGVEHSAINDSVGKIRRVAAVTDHRNLTTLNNALSINGESIAVMERVAFTRGAHIFTAR